MNKYVLPEFKHIKVNDSMAKLQSSGAAAVEFNSCSPDLTGCPTLRLDFGSSTTPPDGYVLEFNCSTSGLSAIPLSDCVVTQVGGGIYDVNCCSSPCCPCTDSIEINGGCCPCGPPPELNPSEFNIAAGIGSCPGTASVVILDGDGQPVSDTITSSDCSLLEQN